MSHFTVLVIGPDHAAALQPFHEFECTGTNDQYVQDIDTTDEKRSEYEADTEAVLTDPQGVQHFLFTEAGDFDVRFCREGTDEFLRIGRKERYVPEGWAEGEVPANTRRTFAQWLQHDGVKPLSADGCADEACKYGYYVTDASGEVVKVVRRTNPNKKWDWWTVGGRWPNKLLFKNGKTGSEGRAGDLDLDGMLAEQARKAAARFDAVMAGIAGREVQSWAQVLKRRDAGEFDADAARALYNGQEVVKDLIASKVIDSWDGSDALNGVLAAKDRASYIQREAQVNSSTWGLLHNGHWVERGGMGWWGMSDATEGSTLDYSANFWLTLRSLAPDEMLTVVDCHI